MPLRVGLFRECFVCRGIVKCLSSCIFRMRDGNWAFCHIVRVISSLKIRRRLRIFGGRFDRRLDLGFWRIGEFAVMCWFYGYMGKLM